MAAPESRGESSLQKPSSVAFQGADADMVKRWCGQAGPFCGFSGSPHNSSLTKLVLRPCYSLRTLR